MPKLGEFIGAILSDAMHARVRADLEAIKIAETYSAHELLKHLPVPRFRLPDITVDFPVLVSGFTAAGAGPFHPPNLNEIKDVVLKSVNESKIRSLIKAPKDLAEAAAVRAKTLFEMGPQSLLSPSRASAGIATAVSSAAKASIKEPQGHEGALKELEVGTRAAVHSLLLSKIVESPSLQVLTTASEIKSHANADSIVRVRLTISEDGYEIISRDQGDGYFLTPE